jgi:transposase
VPRASLPKGPAPESIGLDDWAWRKGHRYGTIIVDLVQDCPIDVLKDRAAETVATWLQAHPDVKIVARDRAEAYAAGMRQGAPDVTQVADRFHLLKNVAAALQEVFNAHHRELDQRNHVSHNEPPTQEDDPVTGPTEPPVAMTKAQQQIAQNRSKRVTEYAQAHAFHQQGWTMKAISTHLGRHSGPSRNTYRPRSFPTGRHSGSPL